MSRGPEPAPSFIDRLTSFSLDRRITVLVLVTTLVVVGAVATLGIPLELIPRGFEEPFLGVFVPWRDAPAPEVLEKITLPLEEELSGIQGLDSLSSGSGTGRSRIWLRFRQGTDMDVAYREIRDRIERARALLPEDADRIFIRKHDESGIPTAVFGLAVDPHLADVYDLVQNEVVLPFSRIDGVASVEVEGLEEKEIQIELDRERAAAAGLNIYELARGLMRDNFTLASGVVLDGGRELLLRSVARYASVEALEARLVGPDVRLRDVARIRYDEPDKDYQVRVNGKPAYAVVVLKEGQANTMEVSRRVNQEFARMKANPRLGEVEMLPLFVQGDVIQESLDTLVGNGEAGALLAVLVLFVFLRRLRLTAIITLSIPLSLVAALGAMFFAGESLNVLSLLGLMISVGMLVDNSIVVAENIHRLHGEGLAPREACLKGASEIALAITAATLTTVVVFLPVALVEGPAQFFLLRLAMPIGVSLAASLVVALVFVPLAVYLTLGRRTVGGRRLRHVHGVLDRWMTVAYDATLERWNRTYVQLLGFFLHRRLDLVVVLIAVLAATMTLAGKRIKITEQQESERAGFELDIDLPAGYSLADAKAYFADCEKVLEAKKQELGLEGYFLFHRRRGGEIEGWFTTPRTSELTPREVTRIVKDALPQKPGVEIYTGTESEVEEGKGKSQFVLPLQGDDYLPLEEVARVLEDGLLRVPGVLGLKKQSETAIDEIGLVVDRDRAREAGVSPAVIAGLVGYALRGTALPRYHKDGKEIPVRIRFQEEDRQGLDELASFAVPTATGGSLPVGALTEARVLPTYGSIFRRDKRITRTITLELEEGKEEKAREKLELLAASLDLPEGMAVGAAAGRQSFDEDLAAMQFAGIMSIVFVYLLMGLLFESFVLPLSVLLTIPLAALGVAGAHLATGLDIDFLGMVGAVLLVGVVVNNGIVLVDYLNRLRAEGHGRDQAILLASERRFRPILMTALTTIIGMVPLTVGGANSIGWSYRSFGLTLVGGMGVATILTLLVVPVFYTLFDDARLQAARAVASVLARRRRPATGGRAVRVR